MLIGMEGTVTVAPGIVGSVEISERGFKRIRIIVMKLYNPRLVLLCAVSVLCLLTVSRCSLSYDEEATGCERSLEVLRPRAQNHLMQLQGMVILAALALS